MKDRFKNGTRLFGVFWGVFAFLLLFSLQAQGRIYIVTNTNDTTKITSLRGTIMDANRIGGNNIIMLGQQFGRRNNQQPVFHLSISGADEDAARTGDLDITRGNLTIIGVGLNVTVDATGLGDRVFQVLPRASLRLENLVITGGNSPTSAAGDGELGGAVFNAGRLVMDNCLVNGNFSGVGVSENIFGYAGGDGGGIYNDGDAILYDCTIANNFSGAGGNSLGVNEFLEGGAGNGGSGGGIYNANRLSLVNCTVSSNSCGSGGNGGGTIFGPGWFEAGIGSNGGKGGDGGGIYNAGTLNMVCCTIAENTGGAGGNGGARTYANNGVGGVGGGVFNATDQKDAICGNDLIACNFAGEDGSGGGVIIIPYPPPPPPSPIISDLAGDFTSQGYNLIGVADGSIGFVDGVKADQVGSIASPIDPLIGPLQMNGGLTPTHALLPGSPAVDQGNSFGIHTDQRGYHRPFNYTAIPNAPGGDGSDIGAFEMGAYRR